MTHMKILLAAALAVAVLARAESADEPTTADLNVNSRYTIESIDFANQQTYALSGALAEEMHRLIGERLNEDALGRLARRITEELRARSVTFRVVRGDQPAHVKVMFDVDKRPGDFDFAVSHFSYTTYQGWSGAAQATGTLGQNALSFAVLSNGDDLVERYSGISARYDRLAFGTPRIRLGLEFDAYAELFNNRVTSSPDDGAYRTRTNVEPTVTFVLSKPLTMTAGLSFERMQNEFPAAGAGAANAVIYTLRYHRRWLEPDSSLEDLDAAYHLRAATSLLGSDFGYTRHAFSMRYTRRHDRHSVEVAVMAGLIYGRAPLFERFVLGNSTTLRGWDKYDLDPLGGNRMAHGSLTYGYRIMRVFYDTGAVWDSGKARVERHSAGVGITTGLKLLAKDALLFAVAFPLRQGHVEPVFVAGTNF